MEKLEANVLRQPAFFCSLPIDLNVSIEPHTFWSRVGADAYDTQESGTAVLSSAPSTLIGSALRHRMEASDSQIVDL